MTRSAVQLTVKGKYRINLWDDALLTLVTLGTDVSKLKQSLELPLHPTRSPSTSCIMGRVLLQYKYNTLLCFVWLVNVKISMLRIQYFFATGIFFSFTSFNSLALKYSVTWRKWDNLVNRQACSVDSVNTENFFFFSREGQLLWLSSWIFFWLVREGQNVGSFKNAKNLVVQPTRRSIQESIISC